MNILEAEGICKAFGGRSVLKSAALRARAGTITLLLGRNGSGKTTLMRIAAGLLAADQGTVRFNGTAYERPTLARLARAGLFYLPERGLMPRARTAADLLQIVAARTRATGVVDVIERFRLRELLEQKPDQLSGGEQRRAELALAWLRAPACLLADEPFMGIAPKDTEEVGAALRDLAGRGCALVISGHEVPVLLDVADEVVWVSAGTTHMLGTPAAAREHWPFRRDYLGVSGR